MATFLDRYLGGECVAVWRELASLGKEVRNKRYAADASAVARETMRRARHNVEILITRLDAIGYRFMALKDHDRITKEANSRVFRIIMEISAKMDPGDKRRSDHIRILRSPEYRKELEERANHARQATIQSLDGVGHGAPSSLKNPNVWSSPGKQTAKELNQLEKLAGGPLPLSLRAWYEEVGGISLLGWHSLLSPNSDEPHSDVCPDPLMIEPLKLVIRQFREEEFERQAHVYLAPDDVTKGGAGGAGPYGMRVPEASADGVFAVVGSRKGPSFINYLRGAFKWGGFPGWEGKRGCPTKLISELAHGLIPL
jgi:hypothetical protein